MWDLPRPGLEPVSPALAGRLSTTAPPGKPRGMRTLAACVRDLVPRSGIEPSSAFQKPFSGSGAQRITSLLLSQTEAALGPGAAHLPDSPQPDQWLTSKSKSLVILPTCLVVSCLFVFSWKIPSMPSPFSSNLQTRLGSPVLWRGSPTPPAELSLFLLLYRPSPYNTLRFLHLCITLHCN